MFLSVRISPLLSDDRVRPDLAYERLQGGESRDPVPTQIDGSEANAMLCMPLPRLHGAWNRRPCTLFGAREASVVVGSMAGRSELSPQVRRVWLLAIGRRLGAVYRAALNQPIPKRLAAMLKQIEQTNGISAKPATPRPDGSKDEAPN